MLEMRYRKVGKEGYVVEKKMIFIGWDDVYEKVCDKDVERDSIRVYENEVLIWDEMGEWKKR